MVVIKNYFGLNYGKRGVIGIRKKEREGKEKG